jgi:hypothetical protein
MISKLKFSTATALLALSSPIMATPALAQEAAEGAVAATMEAPTALLALSSPIMATPAWPQEAAEGAVAATMEAPEEAAPKKSKDEEMFEMLGKMFEIKDTSPIDPKRLAAATKTVGALVPNGVLAKMLDDMAKRFIAPISDMQPDMSVYDIMSATNVYEDSMYEMDDAKRKEITALLDPKRKDRIAQMADAVMPFVNKTMNKIEMPMREGMARAYARKFTVAQLNEMNAFFATPTGALFAGESYILQADPEVMHAMVKAMPKMLEDLKADGPEIEATVKKLPDAKNLTELTDAEMSKLASLTGIKLETLQENKKNWGAVDEAAEAATEAASEAGDAAATVAEAAAADPYADETGEEPWYDDSNWSKSVRANVAKLSKAHDVASEKSSAAYGKWEAAYNAAIAASREKFKAEGWKPEASSGEAAAEAAAATSSE